MTFFLQQNIKHNRKTKFRILLIARFKVGVSKVTKTTTDKKNISIRLRFQRNHSLVWSKCVCVWMAWYPTDNYWFLYGKVEAIKLLTTNISINELTAKLQGGSVFEASSLRDLNQKTYSKDRKTTSKKRNFKNWKTNMIKMCKKLKII